MRRQGNGQQFDRLWHDFNYYADAMDYGHDKIAEMEALKNKVLVKTPKTAYEVHDKANLLDQITNKILRFREATQNDSCI